MPTVNIPRRRHEMIAALQKIAADHGPEVSVARYCRRSGHSNTWIYRYFENWADLRQQAGLSPEVDRSHAHARHTRGSLLRELQTAAKSIGPEISLKEFSYHTGISSTPIYRLFESWRAFKKSAGFDQQRKPGLPARYTKEVVLERVRAMLKEHGNGLTLRDFCQQTGLSSDTVYRFGGWNALRKELGYTWHSRQPTLSPDDPFYSLLLSDEEWKRYVFDPDEKFPPATKASPDT